MEVSYWKALCKYTAIDAFKIDVMRNIKGTNTRLNYLVSIMPRDIIIHSFRLGEKQVTFFSSLTLFFRLRKMYEC